MGDDTISRQAAIDALAKNMPSLTTPDGTGQFDHDIQVTDEAYVDCMQIIHDLPSNSPRWIPVSERLPEIDMSYPHHENYLVQYDSGCMDVATWSNVNRFWTDHVTEPYWNCVQFAEVTAWMPLPQPWKGVDDE